MTGQAKRRVDEESFRSYELTSFDDVIPLAGQSKRPRDKNWTKRAYNPDSVIAECVKLNTNMGIRLSKSTLVVDVDARHGGLDGLAALSHDLGVDFTRYPHVATGGGGFHFYMSKPSHIRVVNGLAAYSGLEFKSTGSQIVASGSIHPDTGKLYQWAAGSPELGDAELDVPASLLKLIARPENEASTLAGGHYSEERLAYALEALDVTKFREQEKWRNIMFSCHHATGGAGLAVFTEWSIGDPSFAHDAQKIALRWNSCSAKRPGAITYRLLENELIAVGAQDRLVAGNAADDFDEVPEDFEFEPEPIPAQKWEITKLPVMLNYVEKAMLAAGVPLYQMGGRLVHPVRIDADSSDSENIRRQAGSLTVLEINNYRLREYMVTHAPFYSVSKKGEPRRVQVAAPMILANHYLARGDCWGAPVLRGIIEAPTLRKDGTVLDEDGYDAESGLLLDKGGVQFPSIIDNPTRDDAESALALLKEPFKSFPFVKDEDGTSASLSVMLSAVLTGLTRRTLHSAPMHCTSAPTMGTGKTLAMDVVSLIVTGRLTTAMSHGANEEEDEKRLFSVLMQNDPILLIDNVKRPIEGDALCTILTQATWQSRILGENRKVAVPTNVLFLASGNNLSLKGDMTTRAILARMDAGVERPETRRFKVDLKAWVPEHRPQLVVAGLTLLRAFIVAGRPGLKSLTPFGRFEDWSNLIRGALVWLGEPDPLETRAFISVDDPERNNLEQLLIAMKENIGDRFCSASEILQVANDITDDMLLDAIACVVPKANTNSLSSYLAQKEGRIVDGLRLERRKNGHKKLWEYGARKT